MSRAFAIWSSRVLRWHTHSDPRLRNSGDDTQGHQARCAQLLFRLHQRPSRRLIYAVLHHDVGESMVGDLPFTTAQTWPALCAAHAEAEVDVLATMGVAFTLTAKDKDWLEFVDRLDSYLWVKVHAPDLLKTPGWQQARAKLEASTTALGTYTDDMLSAV